MHGARYGGAMGDSADMLWVTEDDASSATGGSSSGSVVLCNDIRLACYIQRTLSQLPASSSHA